MAYNRIVEPKGLTFRKLVDEPAPSREGNAVGAVLTFGGTGGAGRFTPVISYLAERYQAGQGDRTDEIDPPDKTRAIVTNASELDAALARGLCKNEG